MIFDPVVGNVDSSATPDIGISTILNIGYPISLHDVQDNLSILI